MQTDLGEKNFFDERKELFLPCDCGEEVMHMEKDREDDLVYIAIYSLYPTMTIWNRLRFVWNALFHTAYYSDQIVLSKDSMKKIVDFVESK